LLPRRALNVSFHEPLPDRLQFLKGALLVLGATMYTSILIPTDGSELAGKAIQHGIALAKRIGAKITVLTVLLPFIRSRRTRR
jgi:hypothetical protein